MTKALALEWARYGIRVNALAPGYFETELNDDFFQEAAGQALIKRIPQRRLGELRELEGPLLLLASEAGSYMTRKRDRRRWRSRGFDALNDSFLWTCKSR
jgi:NAD(P)-dependent dehydrogenase (short-subunit alcohol dehydrogenase family)